MSFVDAGLGGGDILVFEGPVLSVMGVLSLFVLILIGSCELSSVRFWLVPLALFVISSILTNYCKPSSSV